MLTFDEKTIVNNFMVAIKRANMDTDISFVKAKREKDYLKVTISRNGIEDWYHVLKNGTWY
jgi:hypothetical protein